MTFYFFPIIPRKFKNLNKKHEKNGKKRVFLLNFVEFTLILSEFVEFLQAKIFKSKFFLGIICILYILYIVYTNNIYINQLKLLPKNVNCVKITVF